MEGQDVAIIPESGKAIGIPDPAGVLAVAINAAKVLTQVISQKKHPVIMNGEQYLEYEDWQTLGRFDNVAAVTGDAVPVEIDGVKGAKAAARLVDLRTGEVIAEKFSGAEAYCMRDEPKWNTRPVYEWQGEGDDRKKVKVGDEPVPWFQLASMAQTRAGAKALRNRLAWIAVLAGYRPTPAEELTGTEQPGKQERTSEHWCEKHKTNWFKRGAMTSYAHRFEDEEGKHWCNEPVKSTVQSPGTVKDKAQAQADGKAVYPAGDSDNKAGFIDKEWLATALSTLQTRGVPGWTDRGVLAALSKNYSVQGASVMEAVAHLTEEQSIAFCEKVKVAVQGA